MSYTTFNFILFIAATVLVYFVCPFKKLRWVVLLASSFFFYLCAGYQFAVFILFTTASAYVVARLLDRITDNSKNELKANKTNWDKEQKKKYKNKIKNKKRLVMALVLVLNFGILAFLKYYNFFAGSLNSALGSFGFEFSAPTLRLVLPLGISFYTFQTMGYIVDVYREKFRAEKNPAKLLLFVSFFPQIIQGPISMYDQLAHQLYEPHSFDFTRFKYGCELILWGYFKKLVIADRAVIAINAATADYTQYNGTTLLFVVILYALQLYADFSAGIDISRGVAQILGIDMVDNFKRPYFSKDINEYWRRWHITLGGWMKNYVFYPIAMSNLFINMSKKMKGTKFGATKAGAHIAKVLPTSIASFIVFFLVGVWHGANWKYVAFGIWNGGIIMISILLKPVFEYILAKLKIDPKCWWYSFFQIMRTFVIVLIGYVFDIAPGFRGGMAMMGRMITNQGISDGYSQITSLGLRISDYALLFAGALVILVVSLIKEHYSDKSLRVMINSKPFVLEWALLFVCISVIILTGIYGPGYDPAEFVYMQF